MAWVASTDLRGSSRGLLLFLREGMAAWIKAWASLAPSPRADPVRKKARTFPLPANVRGDVVRILATMALATQQEVRA